MKEGRKPEYPEKTPGDKLLFSVMTRRWWGDGGGRELHPAVDGQSLSERIHLNTVLIFMN